MESKLKKEAVKQYSSLFSEQLRARAFQHQHKLNGQEILNLTEIRQVNLFIIQELFVHWKKEVENLRSPYFNYEATEVKQALGQFMDTVSQHIWIDSAHLAPLLNKATQDTLYLILAPYDYYYLLLTAEGRSSWTLEELEERLKYIKINKTLFERLVARCRQEPYREFEISRIIELFSQAFEQLQEPPEDIDTYISKFSHVVPLQSNDLFTDRLPPASPQVQAPLAPSTPIQEEKLEEKPEKKEEARRTLNDYLNKSERSTLADLHQQKKINSLSQHISVNQKFMFVRELFNNRPEAFQEAIEKIEAQNSYAEAIGLVRQNFAQEYRWKMDSEEVLEFMELLSKRF
ncbi:hypothetical protein PZB74_08975 [Porifericola rhodea]|uniref:hypothetical protein n=1 Tax=Porifericola rhodea TaxID=930972 RepID=UPI002664EA40|nr:hypothetical protein [Porifericola rhodea]WKN33463.1 hypothetical protein PZB74_08975 [Porifericola rhodea]